MTYWIKDNHDNVLATATTQTEARDIMVELARKTKQEINVYRKFWNKKSGRFYIDIDLSYTPMCNLYFNMGDGFKLWQESAISYTEAKNLVKGLHSKLSEMWNVKLTWKMEAAWT